MGSEEDYENGIWRLEISERKEGPLLLWASCAGNKDGWLFHECTMGE